MLRLLTNIQPEEGNWYLEDLSSTIALNLSDASFPEGLLTEGSQVIVLGEYDAGVFHVQVGECNMRVE
jgi:hypothetical protein